MQIRLKPGYPHPNILFNLTLPDPTSVKERCAIPSIPQAWHLQTQAVEMMHEDGLMVELPQDLHGLDKATWHTGLVSELVFDTEEFVISCTFVDGHTISWPLPSERGPSSCLVALEGVISAVEQAAEFSLQERMQTSGLPSTSRHGGPTLHSAPVSPVSTVSSGKLHKRQRSLLSSLFAAVKGALSDNPNRAATLPAIKIPSSSHSRSLSTFSRTQQSPPQSPTVAEAPSSLTPYPLEIRPRAPIPPPRHSRPRSPHELLRQQARSALVDIMRRYVLPVFSTTGAPSFASMQCPPGGLAQMYGFPPGQYPAWACRSLLRKTEERMREILSEANAHGAGHLLANSRALRQTVSTTLREAEDDDDLATVSATSMSTETDGSSVHTPTDSPVASPFTPSFVSSQSSPLRLSTLDTKLSPLVPRSPSPPSPDFDIEASAYQKLGNLRAHLQSLLEKMGSTPHQIAHGPPYDTSLQVLEIKSRRRAWSSRDYVGGAALSQLGLAMPFRSSCLARYKPITAETLAQAQAQAEERPAASSGRPSFLGAHEVFAEFGVSVGVKAVTKEMDAQLFPVCEEDEGEDEHGIEHARCGGVLSEYDEEWREVHEFDLDLESGLHIFPRPDAPPTAASAQMPGSMYAHLHPMTRTRTTSMHRTRSASHPDQQSAGGGGGAGKLSPTALLCQPLSKVTVQVPVMLDEEGELGHQAEFTLGMDLPPPPRGWTGEDCAVSCR